MSLFIPKSTEHVLHIESPFTMWPVCVSITLGCNR